MQTGFNLIKGNINIKGVEIFRGGKENSDKSAIDFKNLLSGGKMNNIEGVTIHSNINWCLTTDKSDNITISNSVFADCLKYGVYPKNSNNIFFRNNIIIGIRKPINKKNIGGKIPYETVTGFEFYDNAKGVIFEVSNNILSGIEGIGFTVAGDNCDEKMEYPFWGNEVGSTILGWLPTKNNSVQCMRISGIQVIFITKF